MSCFTCGGSDKEEQEWYGQYAERYECSCEICENCGLDFDLACECFECIACGSYHAFGPTTYKHSPGEYGDINCMVTRAERRNPNG